MFSRKKISNLKWMNWLMPVVVVAVVLLLASFVNRTAPKSDIPEEVQELAENDDILWLSGMWVTITNCKLSDNEHATGIDTYISDDTHVNASVTAQNALDVVQPYYLMVFADGVPMKFEIMGDSYYAYPIELSSEKITMDLMFSPDFSLNIGRIDFLLFFDGDEKSDYHLNSYTVLLAQEGEPQIPSILQTTTAQRDILKGSHNDGTYGAWLWNEKLQPSESDFMGPRDIVLKKGENVLLEAIASKPGLYRTVLINDGRPISFTLEASDHIWLDWKSSGTDMLQTNMILDTASINDGSFFTVSTPICMEDITTSCLASPKIKVTYAPTNEE